MCILCFKVGSTLYSGCMLATAVNHCYQDVTLLILLYSVHCMYKVFTESTL